VRAGLNFYELKAGKQIEYAPVRTLEVGNGTGLFESSRRRKTTLNRREGRIVRERMSATILDLNSDDKLKTFEAIGQFGHGGSSALAFCARLACD
jgi:hypothetical protein